MFQNPYMTTSKKTPSEVSAGSSKKSLVPCSDFRASHSQTVTPSASSSSAKPPSLSVDSSTKKAGISSSCQKSLPMASKSLSALNLRKEVQALKAAQKLKLQQLQKQKEERKLLKKQQKQQQQEELAKENQAAGSLGQSSLAIPSRSTVPSVPPTTSNETVSASSKPSSSVFSVTSTSEPNVAASESPAALVVRSTLINTILPQNDSIPTERSIPPANNQSVQKDNSKPVVDAAPMVTPSSAMADPAAVPFPPPYMHNPWGYPSWKAPAMVPPYMYSPFMGGPVDPYAGMNMMPLGSWSSWVPPPNPYQYGPPQSSFPIPTALYNHNNNYETAQLPVPAKLKVEAVKPATQKNQSLLSMRPLEEPSPYKQSHEIIAKEFVLVKPNDQTSSFGLTVKLEMAHVLVDPALLAPTTAVLPKESPVALGDTPVTVDATAALTPAAESSTSLTLPPAKRTRRRRVCYTVLWVQDPSNHNERVARLLPGVTTSLLQKGDIILAIGGTSVEGLTFSQACALFKECKSTSVDDTVIRCSLSVARYTPEMQKRLAGAKLSRTVVPSTIPPTTTGTNTKLSAQEIMAYLDVLFRTLHAEHRVLGGTEGIVVNSKWTRLCKNLHSNMLLRASNHWTHQWSKEAPEIRRLSVKYLTDAQRSTLRQLPPSLNRCRCGSEEHIFVNDLHCPLYSNLRRVDGEDATEQDPIEVTSNKTDPLTEDDISKKSRALSKSIPRDLNVVEKAYCDRFVRSRTEKQNEMTEFTFVQRMENIQCTIFGQACRAPSLTTMVLSAVADLESEFAEKPLMLPIPFSASPPNKTEAKDLSGTNKASQANDSDDEDDVPLSVLGARYSDPSPRPPKKPRTSEATHGNPNSIIHPMFLARLVQFISYRWGHVFREPSNDEYAWRWEVYHGQLSEAESKWDGTKNPRKVGALSLENLRFLVTDKVVSRLEQKPGGDDTTSPQYQQYVEDMKILGFVLTSCGVYDELLALIRTNVVKVDPRGIPGLSGFWWSHVDILVLDDMWSHWGMQADFKGKYGVADKVRKVLRRTWFRSDFGWALMSQKDDIIFEFEEFDEWRVAFEGKQQTVSDGIDGIGRFG